MIRALFGSAVFLVTCAVMLFSTWLAVNAGPEGFPRPGYVTIRIK